MEDIIRGHQVKQIIELGKMLLLFALINFEGMFFVQC